jgi:hypothetical protein
LVLNVMPGDELADVVLKRYGTIDYEWGIKSASTDFVSVSYPKSATELMFRTKIGKYFILCV